MGNGNYDNAYNNGSDIPYIVSRILEYLIENGNEDFWKAIKYPTYDCLSQPNLTMKEKRDLVYTKGENINNFNVYINMPLIAPEEDKAKTLLKIYKLRNRPKTTMDFVISINFDILTHTTLSNIESGVDMLSRIDFIESQLIDMLNGRDFFFGRITFDRGLSSDSESYLTYNNSNNYFGECMRLVVSNFRSDEGCECQW